MSFKENLLKKIHIDKISMKVIASIGTPESERRVDKKTMRRLLDINAYEYIRQRDIDIFILEGDRESGKFLVLDNDLSIYNTSLKDVVLRKSPTVKEMISISNIIKILNDSGVVVSKKEDSVKTIQQECIKRLDLSFDKTDFEEIAKEGITALEKSNTEGVLEALVLFAELLGYTTPPKIFRVDHSEITGSLNRKESGEVLFGPILCYSITENSLKLIDRQISSDDKEEIEYIQNVVAGREQASKEGPDVFNFLMEAVVEQENI